MTGDMQEYYHMRKHIRHIADADGRNEFVGNQNPAVEFPPTLSVGHITYIEECLRETRSLVEAEEFSEFFIK